MAAALAMVLVLSQLQVTTAAFHSCLASSRGTLPDDFLGKLEQTLAACNRSKFDEPDWASLGFENSSLVAHWLWEALGPAGDAAIFECPELSRAVELVALCSTLPRGHSSVDVVARMALLASRARICSARHIRAAAIRDPVVMPLEARQEVVLLLRRLVISLSLAEAELAADTIPLRQQSHRCGFAVERLAAAMLLACVAFYLVWRAGHVSAAVVLAGVTGTAAVVAAYLLVTRGQARGACQTAEELLLLADRELQAVASLVLQLDQDLRALPDV
jgi:hypothetical protein